jgi:hypothetical protein
MKNSLMRIPATIALCLLNFCVLAPTANAAGTAPGEIGDYVWKDLNQNGIQDPGEPGIPGVTVTLTESFGIPVTTTTDANGLYHFRDLGPGNYTVTVATPSGLIASPTLVAADRAVDSNESGTIVTLQRGAYVNTTIDFGFYPTGSIGNFVWQDLDQNGIQDPGEPGIGGVTVELADAATPGIVLKTALTDNNGVYLFTGLAAGSYQVTVNTSSPTLAGLVSTFSQVPPTTIPATDSDASPLTVVLPTDSTQDLNADFGFIPTPLGAIGNFVWFDRNRNGIQDAPDSEPGISGVTVQLIDLAQPEAPVLLAAQETNADGFYLFEGLQPGSYRVVVDDLQLALADAGWLPTVPSSHLPGATADNDSNVNPSEVTLVLTPPTAPGDVIRTSSDTTIDFGYYRLSSLSGFVYLDTTDDGVFQATEVALPLVTVKLTGTDFNGVPVSLTTTTDTNGRYLFADLEPSGEAGYTITEIQPTGYLDGKDTIGTPGGITANDVFSGIVLNAGIDGVNNNFGELPEQEQGPVVAFLSGYVYVDANNDGLKGTDEVPISDVTVTVTGTDINGNAVTATATTDPTGLFSFLLVPSSAAGYTVTQTQPDGYLDGKDTIGTQGGTTGNDVFGSVVLNPGVNGTDNNFGERVAAAGVCLTKTVDKPKASFGESVTYTYVVTNTGGMPLTNVIVVDDNATPTLGADDFTVGTVALLAPGASQTFTWTLVPATPLANDTFEGHNTCGVIITEHRSDGKTKFTYLQGKDNREGHSFSSGWSGKRSYCSKSLFRVRDKSGAICKDIEATTGAGDGSKYVNSFTVLVDTTTVRKSDGSVNLPDVCHKSGWNKDWSKDWDSCWGDRDRKKCWDDDLSKSYDCAKHPVPCQGNVTNIATVTAKAGASTITAKGKATVCIQPTPAPKVSITKTADVTQAAVGVPVTYTYVVTNTGGVALTNVKVVDDNATPTIASDDVQVGTLVGPLAPGAAVAFTRTLVPPVPMGTDASGKKRCGTLITEKRSDGKTKFTYCQAKDDRSNYSSRTGWKGERSYSRKAQFRVWSGDGKSCGEVVATIGTCDASDYVNSFSVLVKTSSVCDSEGSVKLPDVCHKSGWDGDWCRDWDRDCGDWNRQSYWDDRCSTWDRNKRPVPCAGDVTNIATVTATAGAAAVTAQDSETVKVSPPSPKVAITKTADKKLVAFGVPVTYTYVVTNTGGVALTNLKVVDDNATPTISTDDVEIGTVVGTLAPGAAVTFTKVLVPTVQMASDSYGKNHCGSLITEHRSNGTTKFTYCQEKDERGSYSTSSGWKGDRSYCRKTQFRVWNGNGKTYGDVEGTLEVCDAPEYVNSFSVVVNTSSVCNSDGTVKLPNICHKSGWAGDWRQDWDRSCGDWSRRSYWDSHCTSWDRNNRPVPCASDVTNIAIVTATAGSVTVTAQDSETVKVSSSGN